MGLMGFVNLAHGVFAMAGGYILITAMGGFGVPYPLALALAFLVVGAGSMVLERLLYSRLYTAGELAQVLFTIGLIFIAVATARLLFGTMQLLVPLPDYLKGQFSLLGRDFPAFRVFLIAFSAIMVGALWFGVERTRWGAMVRAAVDNGPMARAIGINTRRLFTLTFGLGSGLAGLGGALGAEILTVQPIYPFEHLRRGCGCGECAGLDALAPPMTWPQGIRRTDAGLAVTWSDAHASLYPYATLRALCRCAACTGGH